MSLYCDDGEIADITPWTPMPKLKPNEYRPPDPERDRCQRPGCRKVEWQHSTKTPKGAA